MQMNKCIKEAFTVIGKEGSTQDGEGFISRLWEDANGHFQEVEQLAKRDEKGVIGGIWGAMSDFSRSFKPWEEHFSKGLYLAGVECEDGAEAPAGWTKWVIPGYEYIYVENESETTFSEVIQHLQENGISLAGAVHDFTCPETGKGYLFFPIRRLCNIYEKCPVLENERFMVRLIEEEDADNLLKVYSDKNALPFFNSDNCHGSNFYCAVRKDMENTIKYWLLEYHEYRGFVRFSIVDRKMQEAIGTIEMFRREADDYFDGYGILRVDVRSDYEKADMLYEIVSLITDPLDRKSVV